MVDLSQRGAIILVFIFAFSLLPIVDAGHSVAAPVYTPDNSLSAYLGPGESTRVFMQCDAGDIFYGDLAIEGGGVVDFFICDPSNYDLWEASQDATLYEPAEDVHSHNWRFQVPHEALWMAVFVNNATSFTIRITAFFFKVAPGAILAFNSFLSLEVGWFAMLTIGSVLFIRRKRSLYLSPRIDLDSDLNTAQPGLYLRRFRLLAASTLLIQCGLITLVVLLELANRWDPGSSYNGFNLLLLFYLVPLILPILLANELFRRRQCKGLLALWSIGASAFGHYFIWAWYIGGGMMLFSWALSYIVPSWIVIAFILVEVISLQRKFDVRHDESIL